MSTPPRIVLLHGLGADRRAFQRFERLLPTDWQVQAIDLLGHGSAPHPESGYELDAHAAYAASAIEDAFPDAADEPVVLVGHSYGAATSVAVAATEPELVAQLVLLDLIHPDQRELESAPWERPDRTGDMIRARRAHESAPDAGFIRATVDQLFPEQSEPLRAWTAGTWEAMSVGVVNELDTNWMRFAADVMCPVTVIHGDPAAGGAGEASSALFDHAVDVRIAGAGHYLHATHARETADAVAAAVRRPGPLPAGALPPGRPAP